MCKFKKCLISVGVFLGLSMVSVGYGFDLYVTNNCAYSNTVHVNWMVWPGTYWNSKTVTLDGGETHVFESDKSIHKWTLSADASEVGYGYPHSDKVSVEYCGQNFSHTWFNKTFSSQQSYVMKNTSIRNKRIA